MNTDINWRDIQEDDSIFLEENKNRFILAQTNICDSPMMPRITVAKYVDASDNRDYSLEETITFYAFLT